MLNNRESMIYYISNLTTGKVSIIGGDNNKIIKEVDVGSRPQNIIVDENDNVYIASNSKVTLIHDLYESDKTWNMPNNGNIQVDATAQKIYVCNTEEVCIYSTTGEKTGCLTGFIAANNIELNMDKKHLFILDVLQCDIKVYDTTNLQLIKRYKDIGVAPKDMIIEPDEKYIYTANKGANRLNRTGNISIIDISTGSVSYIDFKKGTAITALQYRDNYLYAVNTGLNQIEVICVQERKTIANIKTTLPQIQRIKLSPNKKILFAISINNEGKSVVDKIDTNNNKVFETFTLNDNNSVPYDMGVIIQKKTEKEEQLEQDIDIDDKPGALEESNNQIIQEVTTILAKKVLSVYEEEMVFPQVSIQIPSRGQSMINTEEIVFKRCQIIDGTKDIKRMVNNKDYSILKYDFYIPYFIGSKDEYEQRYIMKGTIEGSQKAKLYLPAFAEEKGVQFIINTSTKLTSTPVILDRTLLFDVSVLVSTKAIIDEIVHIPSCKEIADS
ncbi:hypothetical protein GC105_12995 [Alkalibaculum sp. M08DMB]|uniref:YncE family protein n=1 Tax=Alkalibaculum sporogenes TaxID=2655001 RepID=A0A6A7KBZ7_9FIRM|nr:hypothetical protein [Alkalibaculum sporogenes]MPW26707.1 hypothetical protein [Alkalibaculum sporogenes]